MLTVLIAINASTQAAAGDDQADATVEREAVILLHGLGRTWRSMMPLERDLRDAGYEVRNIPYASTKETPDTLVAKLAAHVDACCREASRLHFVGHSLGGILIRLYLSEARPANLGRVVMLSPPNHGSEIVDNLGDAWLFERIMGPSAQQLGTAEDSLPNSLPEPDYEVGIIAASASVNPVGSAIIPGDDDGMVSICNMRLAGMTDFIVVDKSHAFVMQSTVVAEQVRAFLRKGRFTLERPFEGWSEAECAE